MSSGSGDHGEGLEFSSSPESDSDDYLIICLTALYLSNKRQKKGKGAGKISKEGLLSHSTSPSACLLLSYIYIDYRGFPCTACFHVLKPAGYDVITNYFRYEKNEYL